MFDVIMFFLKREKPIPHLLQGKNTLFCFRDCFGKKVVDIEIPVKVLVGDF